MHVTFWSLPNAILSPNMNEVSAPYSSPFFNHMPLKSTIGVAPPQDAVRSKTVSSLLVAGEPGLGGRELFAGRLLQKDEFENFLKWLNIKERTSVSCFGLLFLLVQLTSYCWNVLKSWCFLKTIPNLQSFGGDWDCQKSGWYKVSDEYKTCNATCAAAALTCSTDSSLLSSPGKIKAGQGDDRFGV